VDGSVVEASLKIKAMCFALCDYNLHHEGPHGSLSTEGERSSMMEDAPTAIENGSRRRVMGTVQGMVPGEVSF
jgi:hypothetical protein